MVLGWTILYSKHLIIREIRPFVSVFWRKRFLLLAILFSTNFTFVIDDYKFHFSSWMASISIHMISYIAISQTSYTKLV